MIHESIFFFTGNIKVNYSVPKNIIGLILKFCKRLGLLFSGLCCGSYVGRLLPNFSSWLVIPLVDHGHKGS